MGIPCIAWRGYSLYSLAWVFLGVLGVCVPCIPWTLSSLACAFLSPQLASINRLTLVPGFVSPTGMRHTREASSSDYCLLNQLINALHTPSRADAHPDAQPDTQSCTDTQPDTQPDVSQSNLSRSTHIYTQRERVTRGRERECP